MEQGDLLTNHIDAHALVVGDALDRFLLVRQELVEWWIEQADGHGQAVHRGEDPDEVLALEWQQFAKCDFTIGGVLCEDHFAHRGDAFAFEEHVLGAGEPDALCAPNSRARCASAGESALVRTPMVRYLSDHFMILEKLPLSSGSTVGIEPAKTSPVEPSIEIRSPRPKV